MKCLLSLTIDFFNIHSGMEKNENLPVDNQIKTVSDEKDGSVSDAKFEKLETGERLEVPLDTSSRSALEIQYILRDRFLNISPLKMSGNIKYAAAIDTACPHGLTSSNYILFYSC